MKHMEYALLGTTIMLKTHKRNPLYNLHPQEISKVHHQGSHEKDQDCLVELQKIKLVPVE